MKITKLLVSGAAATGKSSLIALLLGKAPVIKHDSTLLSRSVRHARFSADGCDPSHQWECFDNPADLKELLAGGIKEMSSNDQLKVCHTEFLWRTYRVSIYRVHHLDGVTKVLIQF